MADPVLNDAIMQAIQKSGAGKSAQWIANQQALAQQAALAGLPAFVPNNEESAARLRLIDAIARSAAAGVPVTHFIGSENEPTGDRSVTMDIENLVLGLKAQEAAALKTGNLQALDKISKERAYWENEAAQGMSAQEWRDQTGSPDPMRFPNNIPFRVNPTLR